MQRKEIGGMACLVLTAMIWGFAFVSQVQGMASMSPLFFGATRFTLGALSLIPLLWFRRRGIAEQERRRRESNECPTVTLGNGITVAMPKCLGNPVVVSVICGIVLFTASTVQQYGILYSGSAGRSGFITALYIVMTPLLAFLILRRRVTMNVIVSVAIAVVGFYLLCITDGFGSITLADVVLLSTAVLFAGHILVIDTFGQKMDPILLSFGQISTTALLSWIGSLCEGSIDWAGAMQSWFPHRVRRHRLGRRGIHVAGGRTAAGAAVARGRDHVARIVLLRGGRRVAARRSHDHTSLHRLRADFHRHRARTGSGENTTIAA